MSSEGPDPAQLLSTLDDLPPELSALLAPWHGDLDGMIERRMIRVLTVFNPMIYFLDGGDQRGVVPEAMTEFEKTLNRKLNRRRLRVSVIMIPVARDELIPALLEGRGDVAAANLTITPERLALVDFSEPGLRDVHEVVVTGPAASTLDSLDDLAGRELHLRRSSSYWSSIERLNATLHGAGRPPVRLVPTSEWVEDNGLLELVNTGSLPMTVVDNHKARFWSQFFDRIQVREDLAVRTGGEIAWAFRKNSPAFAEEINAFVRKHRKGTLFGNVLYKRYLQDNRWVRNALHPEEQLRFREMADLFRLYAERYDLDWLLIAAQAYQESRLDQSQRSRAGAVGVMQLLPSTAREIGIGGIDDVENNIHAGVKYLRHVMDTYLDDDAIDPVQRQLLALAAYNAGPSRIRQLRRKAGAAGLDPDVWFQNIEVLAARHIGAEPVRYVSNIMKYYVAYRLLAQQIEESSEGVKT
jgi:membrane-bound lytic murein transglycosylase MltF